MCSIAGLVFRNNTNLKEKKELIEKLLVNMQSRGREATGIALINTEEDKVNILKGAVNSEEFIKDEKFDKLMNELENNNVVLLHTRQPTQGDKKDNKNNHPLYSKQYNSVLVHNGIIRNDKKMKNKFKLTCDGEVDSEVILAMHNKFNNMNKLYTELEGSFAFGLYHDKSLYLLRYGNPIWLGYIKELDLIVFASEKSMIENSINQFDELLGGLFWKKKLKYEVVFREVDKCSYIKFTFNGLEFTHEEKELFMIKEEKDKGWKKNKKDKKKLENFVKDNKPKGWMQVLADDGEEYEGEFDEEDELLWMNEYCDECGCKNYQCVCEQVNRYTGRQNWTEKGDGNLWCDTCQMFANHCLCNKNHWCQYN